MCTRPYAAPVGREEEEEWRRRGGEEKEEETEGGGEAAVQRMALTGREGPRGLWVVSGVCVVVVVEAMFHSLPSTPRNDVWNGFSHSTPVSRPSRSPCSLFGFPRLTAVPSYDSEVLSSETSKGELTFEKLVLSDETHGEWMNQFRIKS